MNVRTDSMLKILGGINSRRIIAYFDESALYFVPDAELGQKYTVHDKEGARLMFPYVRTALVVARLDYVSLSRAHVCEYSPIPVFVFPCRGSELMSLVRSRLTQKFLLRHEQ